MPQTIADMLYIPGARYIYRVCHRIMEGDCQCDHGPRVVTVGPLLAARCPVTNRQFAAYLEESGYRPEHPAGFLRHWQGGRCPEGLLDHPVTWVSKEDAEAYARHHGLRLPTDAEWQYMAAGPDKRAYPWGDDYDPGRCNGDGGSTTPVDAYPGGAGPFGNLDLCGNTWEWVADRPDDGRHRFALLRGGSCYKAPHFWHALGGPHPNDAHLKLPLLGGAIDRSETIGFRCVCDVEEGETA